MIKNVANYKASLSVFKQWNANGIISPAELAAAEERIAKKYGLAIGSIYREEAESVGNSDQKQSNCNQDL